MLKRDVVFLWFSKPRSREGKQPVQGHTASMSHTAKTSPPISILALQRVRPLAPGNTSYGAPCEQSWSPAHVTPTCESPLGPHLDSQASPGVCALHHRLNNLCLKLMTVLSRTRNCAQMRRKNKSRPRDFLQQNSALNFVFSLNWITSNSSKK